MPDECRIQIFFMLKYGNSMITYNLLHYDINRLKSIMVLGKHYQPLMPVFNNNTPSLASPSVLFPNIQLYTLTLYKIGLSRNPSLPRFQWHLIIFYFHIMIVNTSSLEYNQDL